MYEPAHDRTTEKQQMNFKRHFLKDAEKLFIFVDRNTPVAELHAIRSELRKITRDCLDVAKRENRQLNEVETDALDVGLALLEDCREAFDGKQEMLMAERGLLGINGVNNAASVQFGQDAEGRKIPLLSKEHRMADFFGAKGPQSFTAGEFLRSMILGPGDNQELRAALAEGTDSAGGYSVPDIVMAQLIDRMRAASHVVNAGAVTVPLTTGGKTTIARIETDPTPGWRAENGSIAESEPTFSAIQFVPQSLAVLVKVSRELLDDSVNINNALEMSITAALAQEQDRVCLYGAGSGNEPLGLCNVTGASGINVYSMGDNGAQLTNWSPLLGAAQMLANSNAPEPTAAILNPRDRFKLAGLTDTLGQPLRAPDLIAKLPLLSTTKAPTNETQGTAAGVCSSIIMGDFKQLYIGMRTAMRIEILKERFMDNLQYGFICHLRMDVALAHAKAFCRLQGIKP